MFFIKYKTKYYAYISLKYLKTTANLCIFMAAACVNDNIWLGWAMLTKTGICILEDKKLFKNMTKK